MSLHSRNDFWKTRIAKLIQISLRTELVPDVMLWKTKTYVAVYTTEIKYFPVRENQNVSVPFVLHVPCFLTTKAHADTRSWKTLTFVCFSSKTKTTPIVSGLGISAFTLWNGRVTVCPQSFEWRVAVVKLHSSRACVTLTCAVHTRFSQTPTSILSMSAMPWRPICSHFCEIGRNDEWKLCRISVTDCDWARGGPWEKSVKSTAKVTMCVQHGTTLSNTSAT